MEIQGYPKELDYVNAKRLGLRGGPSFLTTFLEACLRADAENYEVIRPALIFFMAKYPADKKRLAVEIHDSGGESADHESST